MKNALILTAFCLSSMGLMAQGGVWYVGGIAGYSSEKSDQAPNPVSTMWYFGPEIGTFFNQQWSAGLVLGTQGANQKDDNGDLMEGSSFIPNLYVRHWWNVGERLNLFAGLDGSFGTGSVTMYDQMGGETKTEQTAFNVNINAGVAYALAERWTLLFKFAALGYTSNKIGDETTTAFGVLADGNITSGQFLFIGLYWSFLQPN